MTQTKNSISTPKRRKRIEREIWIKLTPYDFEILKIVQSCRFTKIPQIHAVVGGGHKKLQLRLRKLFDCGYLDRPRSQLMLKELRKGHIPIVYALGDQLIKDVKEGRITLEELGRKGIDLRTFI